MAKLGISGLVW